jgi:hypothetical protein
MIIDQFHIQRLEKPSLGVIGNFHRLSAGRRTFQIDTMPKRQPIKCASPETIKLQSMLYSRTVI